MFFLLRLAFWLGLVLVLLPRDAAPDAAAQPQVGASEAISAAGAAVADISRFCTRQPAACEVGGQAATVIGHRAQDGARKLYRIITDKHSSDQTGSTDKAGAGGGSRSTLSADDLGVEWKLRGADSGPGVARPALMRTSGSEGRL